MYALSVLSTGESHTLSPLSRYHELHTVYKGFDVEILSQYGDKDCQRIRQQSPVSSQSFKVQSVVTAAKLIKQMEAERSEGFLGFLWQFHCETSDKRIEETERVLPVSLSLSSYSSVVDYRSESRNNRQRMLADGYSPTKTVHLMCSALQKAGFKRFGTEACLLFMDNIGLLNYHHRTCFCWEQCEQEYQTVLKIVNQQKKQTKKQTK